MYPYLETGQKLEVPFDPLINSSRYQTLIETLSSLREVERSNRLLVSDKHSQEHVFSIQEILQSRDPLIITTPFYVQVNTQNRPVNFSVMAPSSTAEIKAHEYFRDYAVTFIFNGDKVSVSYPIKRIQQDLTIGRTPWDNGAITKSGIVTFDYEHQLILAGMMFLPSQLRPFIVKQGLAVVDYKFESLVMALPGWSLPKVKGYQTKPDQLYPISSLLDSEATQAIWNLDFLRSIKPVTVAIE